MQIIPDDDNQLTKIQTHKLQWLKNINLIEIIRYVLRFNLTLKLIVITGLKKLKVRN